jgi:thioredoxin-like negative regulator of GroEL
MKRKQGALFIVLTLLTISMIAFSLINLKARQQPAISLAEYNQRTTQPGKIIMAYFSAGWCAICSKMKPLIEQIEIEQGAKLELLKIDTDRDKEVAREFDIDALPVIILYKNGKREWIHVGLIDKPALKAKINSL